MQQNLSESVQERVLFVHAHPDDETISTGGTIATLVNRGAAVTVVTCTRGERGEVIPPDLRHLEGAPAELAAHRSAELAAALAVLGVTDHRYLGAAGARWVDLPPRVYTDSGMRWGADGAEAAETIDDDSLCAAPFGEVAADLATVIDAVQPTAVVSYDARGGYGHPDHVRAHEAARRAAEVMGVPFFAIQPDGSPAPATVRVDVSDALTQKADALRAHRTQVTVEGDRYSLSSGPSRPIAAEESYAIVRPDRSGTVAWKDQGFGIHLFAWIIALIVGAAVGGISTVNHQATVSVGGLTIGIGIIATLMITAALLVGLRLVFGGRLVSGIAAFGQLAVIGALSLTGSGGSILVPANAAGYLLTYGPAVIALVVLAWPSVGTFRRDKIAVRLEPKGTPSP
ncbi:PIG-L family deacetylase [Lacisediminihabitans sp.]|uniref:PIG-L family deacetylase n=1 Tax=Lacisediminihabitans sp. TaxID=2787631 RepID=UPI002F933EFA